MVSLPPISESSGAFRKSYKRFNLTNNLNFYKLLYLQFWMGYGHETCTKVFYGEDFRDFLLRVTDDIVT